MAGRAARWAPTRRARRRCVRRGGAERRGASSRSRASSPSRRLHRREQEQGQERRALGEARDQSRARRRRALPRPRARARPASACAGSCSCRRTRRRPSRSRARARARCPDAQPSRTARGCRASPPSAADRGLPRPRSGARRRPAASPRITASTSSPSARVGTRTSTMATASGAITLGRSPPSIVPTFTVIPRSASLRANRRWIWCESSRMALSPSSGATPACAARPRTVTR